MDYNSKALSVEGTPRSAFAASGATRESAGASPLGNTAKSSPPPGRTQAQAKRAERYQALATARRWIFRRANLIDPNRDPGDMYRTHDCRYVRRDRFVQVHHSAKFQAAHFSNLATCGSVWACPVCCALVQQRRRDELSQLVTWAYANGYEPAMVTFTFPHRSFHTLADLKAKQADAFTRLRRGAPWQRFKQRCGFAGLVRSLEVTYGENGWHPHTHELWLVKRMTEAEQASFVTDLRDRWLTMCARAGLVDLDDLKARHAFQLHAVDVRFGVSCSDYLVKQDKSRAWGADHEIASSSSKKGRASGVHPHEFLVRRAPGDADRFFEYVDAMKGARQLFWSHGLKELVGLEELTDEEISEESREEADLLGLLNPDQWDFIRKRGARAHVLDAAESGGWPAVLDFLGSIGWDWYADSPESSVLSPPG